ncbi:MAG: hypothetical protein LBR23_01525, partial [Spirochaetaceae bacterium]|nr:hypothetical protein [Spirochaetaceae bacterium]
VSGATTFAKDDYVDVIDIVKATGAGTRTIDVLASNDTGTKAFTTSNVVLIQRVVPSTAVVAGAASGSTYTNAKNAANQTVTFTKGKWVKATDFVFSSGGSVAESYDLLSMTGTGTTAYSTSNKVIVEDVVDPASGSSAGGGLKYYIVKE